VIRTEHAKPQQVEGKKSGQEEGRQQGITQQGKVRVPLILPLAADLDKASCPP
jgi:hypothetical protein